MAAEGKTQQVLSRQLALGWSRFTQGWSEALRWPAFSWLDPDEPVRVHHPDGTSDYRQGTSIRPSKASRARTIACMLPEDRVLTHELLLPDLPAGEVAIAIALHAEAASPFPPGDTTLGWHATVRDDGRIAARIALASRAQVVDYIARAGHSPETPPEVWAGGDPPIVLQGFGEAGRRRRVVGQRRLIGASALLLVVLCAALAWTPIAIQRERVADARAQLARLAAETDAVMIRRDTVVRASGQLAAVRERIEAAPDVAALLDLLTHLLPDNAHLTRMEVDNRQVRITGFAANATQLIETLGGHPDLSEVRTPTAIARNRDGRESFSAEFRFDGGRSWR